MLFRMGPRRAALLRALELRHDFVAGCRGALGIATDEPLPGRPSAQRVYVFSPKPWDSRIV